MAPPAECANPQLLEWVKEWLDVARERNSKGVTTYRNAYESLKACPITFQHPSALQQLKGFGPKLCDRLTDQLKQYCQQNGLPMPEDPRTAKKPKHGQDGNEEDGRPAKKPRKQKAYVPAFRSGAYALVLGLSTIGEDAPVGMTKAELIEVAQPHCDSSLTAPSDPTKFYTAWNSMKTLIQKELVYERGRPLRRYSLTDEGWETAKRIKAIDRPDAAANLPPPLARQPTNPSPERGFELDDDDVVPEQPDRPLERVNVVADGPAVGPGDALPDFTPIRLEPGTFSVRLLLDVREVRAKTDRDYMQEELSKQGVKPIMRSLELGDCQWVAKCHDPELLSRLGAEGDEVVLDWIVERKRLDDLVSSIKDGRFHEQKFRLKRSGVRNVVYVIEEISMDAQHFHKYEEAVQSAIASTQVVNGYFVKRTQKMDETIRYLARMTAMLRDTYEARPLRVIPTRVLTAQNYLPLLRRQRERDAGPDGGWYITYPAFASLSSKSDMMTLRDVFLKMLMTTRGVTGEKAIEIQKCWRTPYDFVKAFESCGAGEAGRKKRGDLVAQRLNHLIGRKKVGKAVSQRIAEVWGGA